MVSAGPDEETGEKARGRRINQRALVLAAITIALVGDRQTESPLGFIPSSSS